MDRIERFLNRRPVKNKRKVKCDGKEFVINKEDVQMIRRFKRNDCIDPDVDLYRPLDLRFSRMTGDGLEMRRRVHVPIKKTSTKKVSSRKRSNTMNIKRDKNEIVDVWNDECLDDLNDYDQDLFVKIGESYSGSVESLRYGREDLEKNLRNIYLRLYEPREKKEYRLKDLIKELPRPETLRPFPEEIGLVFEFGSNSNIRVGISKDMKRFGIGEGKKLSIYEFKRFMRLKSIMFNEEIRKIEFSVNGSVCVLVGNKICIVDDVYDGVKEGKNGSFCYQEYPTWSRNDCEEIMRGCTVIMIDWKINSMNVHPNGKYIGVVCGKNVMMYDLESRDGLKVLSTKGTVPLRVKFHRTLPRMIISTTNSLIIYDLVEKRIINEAKEFSFVLDFFSITDDVVVLVNNLNKVILYNHSRNVLLRTMLQEDVGTEVIHHERYNLMCVVYPKELVLFHNNLCDDVVVPVKRIRGRYRDVSFHPSLPWLYGSRGNKLVVIT